MLKNRFLKVFKLVYTMVKDLRVELHFSLKMLLALMILTGQIKTNNVNKEYICLDLILIKMPI